MSLLGGRRWRLLSLAVVAISAVGSGAYVYWRVNAPSSALYVTATSPPLELRMELDKTDFQLNETVAIHLSLKNIGDKTITIFVPYIDTFVGFIIKDRNGTVVLNYPRGGFASVDEATLEPRDQISKAFNWSQFGHYPDGSGGVIRKSVPPGMYHVIGRTGEYLMYSFEAEDWVDIKTLPITITIG